MRKIENIPYCKNALPAQQLDLWLPDGDSFPVFVFFHGGGLVSGDKGDESFLLELTGAGIAVASANYRMFPDAAYPDYLEDAAMAVKWVQDHIGEYGQAQAFFVGGSSAGGYISQMLLFDARWLSAAGADQTAVSGYILDAGQPTAHYEMLRRRGIDPRRVIVDDTAPLYHVDDSRPYPPMLLIVADNDMQNRMEQTMLLYSTLKHFGQGEKAELKIVENSTHCQYHSMQTNAGKNLFGEMVLDFIRRHA